ncbi:MAG TPA: DUF6504 family protein [Ktedonobacterales bacterium]|nr:DUF6504 family protein [Ktedonobacterales bacterium]
MTRLYGQPIQMRCAPASASDSPQPHSFRWRERTHVVTDLLSAWHLQDRWWQASSKSGATPSTVVPQASDRSYYRLTCADGLLCDVYYDATLDQWVLDRVYD